MDASEIEKMNESFSAIWEEYPASKGSRAAAEKEWRSLWKERGQDRMLGGVQRIVEDMHCRADKVKNKYSPFWHTSLSTYLASKPWASPEVMPIVFSERKPQPLAMQYRLPDRLKAPVSDVYDDTLDDIPF